MIEQEIINFAVTFLLLFAGDCILGICYGYNKKLGITLILLGLIGLLILSIYVISIPHTTPFTFYWGSMIAGFIIGIFHSTIWKKATDLGKEIRK